LPVNYLRHRRGTNSKVLHNANFLYHPQLEDGLDFLDTKLPQIRGRPAFQELTANLKPGLTVALVSLPLSISLAIASGASPVQGIITAAWAGLTSAALGGSHYNVVGPTGEFEILQRNQSVAPRRWCL
jgi:hypothetical protein